MTCAPAFSLFRSLLRAPAPPQFYTLSLHDALPIFGQRRRDGGGLPVRQGEDDDVVAGEVLGVARPHLEVGVGEQVRLQLTQDRKSTRLNSSHLVISYAVFCLKKKKR